MRVSGETIGALLVLATGDPPQTAPAPYRSLTEIKRLFADFPAPARCTAGASRKTYAEEHIRAVNDTDALDALIGALLNPAHFDTVHTLDDAAAYLAPYLSHDGFELYNASGRYRIRSKGLPEIDLGTAPFSSAAPAYIDEQVGKCQRKIATGDYDGAITNARTLTEAVLQGIEREITKAVLPYDGDLPRLYKRVQGLLNLGPEQKDLSESLKSVLRGLAGIVQGLATLRNRMSDAHPAVYRPAKHHAQLAVNSAKTLCQFMFDTYEYQRSRAESGPPTVTEVSE